MAENSKIEWTDHTFNPWEGCQKVGPGCDHCYAEARNVRFGGGVAVNWGPGAPRRRTSAANWRKPLQWEREAAAFLAAHGRRQRVFCASLADVFDNQVDPTWRADLFDLILATPNLDWLLLTKRIGNAAQMIAEAQGNRMPVYKSGAWPLPNVWLGATVVNQEEADRDIPKLLQVPARVRFLSIEPMLGPIDLTLNGTTGCEDYDGPIPDIPAIDWVICGGESGSGARPMHPDWARSLRDQCAVAGTPFLFKQWGEWLPGQNDTHPYMTEPTGTPRSVARHQDGRWGATDTKPTELNYVTWKPDGTMHSGPVNDRWRAAAWAERVGKKAAGRLLDGVEHNGFPNVKE